MKNVLRTAAVLAIILTTNEIVHGQEKLTAKPVCAVVHGPKDWSKGCFPRVGCPDDYTPNPLPRQCWPPYPPYYQCVPAGIGKPPKDCLTLWFIPTPKALKEALGFER